MSWRPGTKPSLFTFVADLGTSDAHFLCIRVPSCETGAIMLIV